MTFYDKLLSVCNEKGYKIADVAKELGITRASVSHWKNGKNSPSDDNLAKIAQFLGVEVTELIVEKKPTANGSELIDILQAYANPTSKSDVINWVKNIASTDELKEVAQVLVNKLKEGV